MGRIFGSSIIAILLVLGRVGFAQISYSVTDIGALGTTQGGATGINNNGQVVGSDGNGNAFLYSNGSTQLLGAGYPLGINDGGQIVGYRLNTIDFAPLAFLYSNDSFQAIGSDGTEATGINDSGEIVGVGGPGGQAFIYSNGSIQSIGGGAAYGINNSGEVVGSGGDGSAFLYSNGSMHDLTPLVTGHFASATAINSSGQIVGTYGADIAFLYSNNSLQNLGAGKANGINDSGQIVGTDGGNAYLYSSGGSPKNLNSLIAPNSGWNLTNATAINNLGQIAANATNTNGQMHAVLLTPSNYFPIELIGVPMPTAAPSVSSLPSVQHFYSDLHTVLQLHASEFSPSTLNYLNSMDTSTAPLIDPNSPDFLKVHAASIANGLRFVSNAVDGAVAIVSPGSLASKVIDLGMTTLLSHLPSNSPYTTVVSTAAFVGGVAGKTLKGFDPTTFLISANTYIYGTWVANELDNYGKDPADLSFQTIYTVPISLPANLPTTGNAQLDAAFSSELTASLKTAAYLQAANASFDKYSGAIQANDNLHATLQMEALLGYLRSYDQAAQDAATDLENTQNLLQSLGLLTGSYDPNQLLSLQSDITANGLPGDLQNALAQLGLTTDQQQQIEQQVLSIDPNSFSGTVASNSDQEALTLIQGTTAAVPEPNAIFIFLALAVFLPLIRSRCRSQT